MKSPTALVLLALVAGAPLPSAARDASLAKAKYLDPKLPVEKRVADLLARMTLEEKIAQLHGYWFPKSGVLVDEQLHPALNNDKARALLAHGLGEISRPSENEDRKKNLGPRQMAELTNALQKYVIEQTRLGIPLLNHEEGLHGLQAPGATSYPQPIALAASFDPALVEEVMTAVAQETRARGAHHTLAPVVDVMRDPRWGRTEETYGEDPYLVSRMGVAAVQGLQGRAAPGKIDPSHVMATLKHFAVHGQPEAGMNAGPGNYSERVIREVFFPPFVAAIKEAHVRAIMPAYVEIDGVPAHANKLFLQDILRKEWGFDGLIVSDYFAVEQLNSLHHVVDSDAAAARLAFESGVDLELPDPKLYPLLADQVKSKAIPMALIDKSVARVLRAKFELGLFEQPYVDVEQADKISGSAEHAALARKAADRSIVLLKNAGNLLPLDRNKVKSIAVIGPNGEPCRLGGYSGVPKRCIGVLRGIRDALGPTGAKVLWAPGCGITRGSDWWADKVDTFTAEEDRKMIDDAVAVARKADVIVLAVGDSEQSSREGWAPNHLGDRPSLDLPGRQEELVRAILAVGRPTVAVLLNGRPPSINQLAQQAGAILEGFYLGQEGGATVAAALFGDINPGGKLPVSVARSAGHLPIYYNYKPSARRGYLFDDVTPLYPFGHGLSYTTFAYKNVKVTPAPTKADADAVTVSVDVSNTGARAGDEVAQLYLRDVVSSVTRPVKELKGFQRVTLKPGETKAVSFTLGHDALGFWKTPREFVVEPGKFDVTVGGSSAGGQNASFEVKGPAAKKPALAAKTR